MFAVPAMAKLYKCEDADGSIIYTDEPCAEGKELKLPPLQTYTPAKLPPAFPDTGRDDKKELGYTSLVINKPEDDSVVRDNTGTVNISYTLTPALDKTRGHRFSVALDGKQLKTKGTTSEVQLSDIDRGTHTIQIHVVDEQDKVLISSKPTTFHMKRYSILHPKPSSPRSGTSPTTPTPPQSAPPHLQPPPAPSKPSQRPLPPRPPTKP
jgi:hypothetical protein